MQPILFDINKTYGYSKEKYDSIIINPNEIKDDSIVKQMVDECPIDHMKNVRGFILNNISNFVPLIRSVA